MTRATMTRRRATSSSRRPELDQLTVGDAMHSGIVSCPPETTLRSVARMLATYRVHAVVVLPRHGADAAHVGSWGIVTDVAVARAALDDDVDLVTAGEEAATPARRVAPGDSLGSAIETMLADGLSHVIVVDPQTGRPVGMLSQHDVARALAAPAGER